MKDDQFIFEQKGRGKEEIRTGPCHGRGYDVPEVNPTRGGKSRIDRLARGMTEGEVSKPNEMQAGREMVTRKESAHTSFLLPE